jgi:hypothetical protein
VACVRCILRSKISVLSLKFQKFTRQAFLISG